MAIKGDEFLILMGARDKLKANKSLSSEELAMLEKHQEFLDFFKPKLCGCSPGCTKELEPRVDGERPKIEGREVNPDCYYGKFGDEIEKHPIGGHGIRRGRSE